MPISSLCRTQGSSTEETRVSSYYIFPALHGGMLLGKQQVVLLLVVSSQSALPQQLHALV